MKLVIAATGASGAIYLQRLLAQIDCAAHEVHLVMSAHAGEVAKQELDDFKAPPKRSERTIRQRLSAFRRDGDCPLFDGYAGANRLRLQRQRTVARGRCFLEGTPEIDSRPAGDAVEFNSRAERCDVARGRGDCAAGDSFVLQPSRFRNCSR